MTPAEMAEIQILVMKKANRRRSQCSGKWKFATFEGAKVAIRHRGMEPYRCGVCSQFHVGTPDRMRRVAIKGARERLKLRSRELDEEVAA